MDISMYLMTVGCGLRRIEELVWLCGAAQTTEIIYNCGTYESSKRNIYTPE